MTKDSTPKPKDPNEVDSTNAAETFFSGEAVSSESTPQVAKNKWLIPGVAFASVALLSGALGFASGSNNSPEGRPVAMSGKSFDQNDGQAPGDRQGRGMNDQGRGMNDQGRGMNDRQGQGNQRGPGQMMPGNNQRLPHCHDAAGNDLDANADGTCVDGSTPGFIGGKNTSPNQNPAPMESGSPTVQ